MSDDPPVPDVIEHDEPSLTAVAALAAKPFDTLDETIDAALRLMSDVIGINLSMIHRLEGDLIVVSHMHDRIGLGIEPPVTIKRTDTFCDVVIETSLPLIVPDADDPQWAHLPGKQMVGTKTYIGVPILLRDNRIFGTLCAHDRRSLDLNQGDIDLLLVLARLVASHIEREEALTIEADTARRLAIRNADLAEANSRLRALNEIAESVSANLDLRSLLETVVRSGVTLLGAHGGAISLIGDTLEAPRRLTAVYNLPPSLRIEAIPSSSGLMGQVIAARSAVIVERYNQIDFPLPHAEFHEMAPWIAVPIWWQGEILGTFGIGARDEHRSFSDHDIELLTQLAKHAAIAIENARLYAASRELGAAEERNRLAAEIHDTLAQSLLALTFQLRTARSLVTMSPDRAANELRDAEERTRAALDEARRSVWNLGPASLEAGSLVEALQGELAASERFGLPGTLTVSGSPRPLAAETQLALFRIAQESLANARKHARASSVTITLSYGERSVALIVADDGVGFDVDAAAIRSPRIDGGYGLVSIDERISRVGGDVHVESARGAGTRVIANAPYDPRPASRVPDAPAAAPAAEIRVIVADDHPATRSGIAGILREQAGVAVIATAANGEEAVGLVEALQPDILMIDLRMPVLSGVEAIARISKLGVKTRAIAVTTFAQDELVYQAMRSGARGFLLKDASADELARAVRIVHAGGTLLDPSVAGKLAQGITSTERLTTRERQVLALLARGLPDKEIATELGTSVKTANFHAANVIAKLGAANRAEAVRLAYERGLLH